MKTTIILTAVLALFSGGLSGADNTSGDAPAPAKGRPNVLFIPVDDLNHWIGHLGRNQQTKTPHLDRLASDWEKTS